MEYKFYYNLINEIKVAKEIVADLEWYNKNGYNALLPNGIDNKSSFKELKIRVKEEMVVNKNKFKLLKKEINKIFKENKKEMDEFFSNFGYIVPNVIEVYLTGYGPGGSYYTPNKIIVLAQNNSLGLLETIVHESVHLIIEKPFIQKNKIVHWQKEMVVDVLCGHPLLEKIYGKSTIQNNSEKISEKLIGKLKFKNKKLLKFNKS